MIDRAGEWTRDGLVGCLGCVTRRVLRSGWSPKACQPLRADLPWGARVGVKVEADRHRRTALTGLPSLLLFAGEFHLLAQAGDLGLSAMCAARLRVILPYLGLALAASFLSGVIDARRPYVTADAVPCCWHRAGEAVRPSPPCLCRLGFDGLEGELRMPGALVAALEAEPLLRARRVCIRLPSISSSDGIKFMS
mmetsp:Transcript_31821/g.57958  ORF Transcript_31821/g.57958 Transcript_31821/m.57958 type:complete len:194 (-) Transcript_31821:1048-1629(-)